MDTSETASQQNTAWKMLPRYQKIAFDLASKIASGTYKEGSRLYGRSALAGQYGVSGETVRRAICILEDLGIVESKKGSGVTIISPSKAISYVRNIQQTNSVAEIKQRIRSCVERQQEETKYFSELLDQLMLRIERFRAANPFIPYQITVPEDCDLIGRNLQEINFWHNTIATIVGIRRGDELKLSPGPYAELCGGDILYFIGDPGCVSRVDSFLGIGSGSNG